MSEKSVTTYVRHLAAPKTLIDIVNRIPGIISNPLGLVPISLLSVFVPTRWVNNAFMNDFSPNTGRRSFQTTRRLTRMVRRCFFNRVFLLVEVAVGMDDLQSPLVDSHLFSRQPHDADNTFTNIFSIPSPNQRSLRSRVFVTHIGQDSGSGVWRCSKDPTSNCPHITTARHFLQKLIQADPTARDNYVMNTPLDYTGKCSLPVFHHAELEVLTRLLQFLSFVARQEVNIQCPT